MKLFNESENKYYELLSYLINDKDSYTNAEIIKYLNEKLDGSHDYDIEDLLFDQNPDNATVFTYKEGKYIPVLAAPLPIRNNRMDLQTIKSLVGTPFSNVFLSEKTKDKLERIAKQIKSEWSFQDVRVKNQFQNVD